jgi:hypothetical protein
VTIKLQGILPSQDQEIKEVSMEPQSQSSALSDQYLINGVPSQIIDLIRDFDSIFQEHSSLPPSRTYDHSITILSNAPPTNCIPYRYSPK